MLCHLLELPTKRSTSVVQIFRNTIVSKRFTYINMAYPPYALPIFWNYSNAVQICWEDFTWIVTYIIMCLMCTLHHSNLFYWHHNFQKNVFCNKQIVSWRQVAIIWSAWSFSKIRHDYKDIVTDNCICQCYPCIDNSKYSVTWQYF